ncbi:MAG: hypothetical protein WBV43_17165 [Pseudolabrys sp.]
MDVELIRRREIVERRVPKLAWIGLAREDVVSPLRRHAQRMRPRIELCLLDGAEDAGDRKIVIIARVDVRGVTGELLHRRLRCRQVFAHCHERLAILLP